MSKLQVCALFNLTNVAYRQWQEGTGRGIQSVLSMTQGASWEKREKAKDSICCYKFAIIS